MDHDLGMPFWNAFYVVSQVVVLPLTLFLVYRYARGSYAFLRNMALLSWSAGLVWYALQPVAPPRLLTSGFTDTVSSQTFFQLNSGFIRAFYNPVAAMPSLHVGMAPVVAWALIRLTPWMWSKALGVAYPLLVATSIVVTGNHFILDIAGGLAVVLPAAAISEWLVREPRASPGRLSGALRSAGHRGRDGARPRSGPSAGSSPRAPGAAPTVRGSILAPFDGGGASAAGGSGGSRRPAAGGRARGLRDHRRPGELMTLRSLYRLEGGGCCAARWSASPATTGRSTTSAGTPASASRRPARPSTRRLRPFRGPPVLRAGRLHRRGDL